jgi:hypothetical protein
MKTERRYRMDERVIEEEGKDRDGEGWGIGIKKVYFFWKFLESLFYVCFIIYWRKIDIFPRFKASFQHS